MKLFSFLSIFSAILCSTGLVHAEVKMPGTVLASQCGEARETNPRLGGYSIVKVCEGTVVGSDKTYLIVDESRVLRSGAETQTTIWEVTRKTKSAKGSSVEVNEVGYRDGSGRFQEKVATSVVVGKVNIQHGRGNYTKMTGKLGGREFVAVKFQNIYHTM